MVESPEPGPARPTPAGIYDYLLGGQHFSVADQAAAEQAVAMAPATRSEVTENRAFLRRAVRYLASGAVYQTAAELIASPRVVYVDNDPRVAEISRAFWTARTPRSSCATCAARRRSPAICRPQRLIDWSRPVAVLMVSILHFIQDEDDPAAIVAAFREQMSPGSYLVLSHGVVLDDPEFVRQVSRTRDQVAGFLAGFDLVPPGLVTTVEWGTDQPPATGAGSILAAVGAVSG